MSALTLGWGKKQIIVWTFLWHNNAKNPELISVYFWPFPLLKAILAALAKSFLQCVVAAAVQDNNGKAADSITGKPQRLPKWKMVMAKSRKWKCLTRKWKCLPGKGLKKWKIRTPQNKTTNSKCFFKWKMWQNLKSKSFKWERNWERYESESNYINENNNAQ